MPTRFFRAGVGTVIYTKDNHVAFFRRKKYPAGIWQFQQGGIDENEHPEETLWRELREEVGLTQDHIVKITEVPGWTVYQDLHTEDDATERRLGQAHRWFFLELKEDTVIDLTNATEDEFDDWKWVSFEEAVELTNQRKRHVYESLLEYYRNHIV